MFKAPSCADLCWQNRRWWGLSVCQQQKSISRRFRVTYSPLFETYALYYLILRDKGVKTIRRDIDTNYFVSVSPVSCLTREARVRLKTGNKGHDKMDVRPEQTLNRNAAKNDHPRANTQKYPPKTIKMLNWDGELQFIDGFSAFWITIEGDKHPPPAAWPVSPTVTPRGRRRLLQKRFRVCRQRSDFTYSPFLLFLLISSWKLSGCVCSVQSRSRRPCVLCAKLIIFSRSGRVGLT